MSDSPLPDPPLPPLWQTWIGGRFKSHKTLGIAKSALTQNCRYSSTNETFRSRCALWEFVPEEGKYRLMYEFPQGSSKAGHPLWGKINGKPSDGTFLITENPV